MYKVKFNFTSYYNCFSVTKEIMEILLFHNQLKHLTEESKNTK